jgi:Mrp family chromosome partitioning ATPase
MHERLEESGRHWASLWAAKWLILATAVAVGVLTYAYYDRKPRVYAAHATLLVGTSQADELLRDTPPVADDRSLNNQAALLNSEQFALAVRRSLQRKGRPVEDFDARAAAAQQTDLLSIESSASSPTAAALVANQYAREYIDRRRRQMRLSYRIAIDAMRRQIGRGASSLEREQAGERLNELETLASVADPGAELVDVAQPVARAVTPRPLGNAVFGFVLGLVLASGVVYLRSRLDRRIRSLAELERVFRRQVLAAIPPLGRRSTQIRAMSEPLRRLITILELDRGPDTATRRVLITSAQKGEGKSTVVSGLALVARDAGLRVAVVDADLRAPVQAQLLHVETVPGLSDVLAGRIDLDHAWQVVDAPALQPAGLDGDASVGGDSSLATGEIQVLASGTRTPNPSTPLASPMMPLLLDSRSGDVDYVIVDAPPPLAVSDALPLLSSVDAIVVVSKLGETTHAGAQRLVELLEHRTDVPVVGVVANGVPEDESTAFGFVSADRYPS